MATIADWWRVFVRGEPRFEVESTTVTSSHEPTIHIAVVTIRGRIPGRRVNRALSEFVGREIGQASGAAIVFDLRTLDVVGSPRHPGPFLSGLCSQAGFHRCHYVLSSNWRKSLSGYWRNSIDYESVEAAVAAAETDEMRRHQNAQKQAKLNLTRVILRGGLGDLQFGASQDEVRALMGDPDSLAETLLYGGSAIWFYDDADLDLTFKNVTGRGECLVEIRTASEKIRLLGVQLNSQNYAATKAALQKAGVQHKRTNVYEGQQYQYFSGGLTLSKSWSSESVDYAEWSILPAGLRDEDIDWSGRDRIG